MVPDKRKGLLLLMLLIVSGCILPESRARAFSFGSARRVDSRRHGRPLLFLSSSSSPPQPPADDEALSIALSLLRGGTSLIREIGQGSPTNLTKSEQEKEDQALDACLALENDKEEPTIQKKNKTKNSSLVAVTKTKNDNTTNFEEIQQDLDHLFQTKLKAFNRRAQKTRILLLRRVAAWAFTVSDHQQQGKVDRQAFYTGVLLVHLRLAQYVGVAACQPPTRDQVDELFSLADADGNAYLTKEEFTAAVLVATAPITSRIAVYWMLLAILPILVTQCMTTLTTILAKSQAPASRILSPGVMGKTLSVVQLVIYLLLSRILFSFLVPNIFARIDRAARRRALKRSRRRKASTSLWWLKISITSGSSSNSGNSYVVGRSWLNEFRQPFWPGYQRKEEEAQASTSSTNSNEGEEPSNSIWRKWMTRIKEAKRGQSKAQ